MNQEPESWKANMLPRISVVIPFRNMSRWLPETLASLALQQGVFFELVAVDDGSEDDSRMRLLQCCASAPWDYRLLHTEGVGVSQARNLGWQAASAPLVAFLDGDDLCLPGRLAGQASKLMEHPELAHVVCGWQRIDSQGNPLQDVTPWRQGAGFSVDQAFRHKAILPSAWMVRRSVLAACGGFNPVLSQAEDVDLLLRLALAGHQGAWWEGIGCGYRVHPESTSRQSHNQARSLLWVIHRHLARLPTDPSKLFSRLEVHYSTRAWTGWNAWRWGERELAFELWRTALGISPLPPALTWVHMAENVVRSSAREGETLASKTLLDDPIWQRLQTYWRDRLLNRHRSQAPLPSASDPWLKGSLALVRGRAREGLSLWKESLLSQLGATPVSSRWHPQNLFDELCSDDPLLPLRREVLNWALQLIRYRGDPTDAEDLTRDLARILWRWACVSWSEDRRPTARRLEECAAVLPNRVGLQALARLHREDYPTGAAALKRLSEHFAPVKGIEPAALPSAKAFWEVSRHRPDHCNGPACLPCIKKHLADWTEQPIDGQAVVWQPPDHFNAGGTFTGVEELPGGQAWVRPPFSNPWGMTHAVGVADGHGEILPQYCRRYPFPWPTCPWPTSVPEPIPAGEPLALEGSVLAVADLSAEGYYHWLLESLPRLGMALEVIAGAIPKHSLRIWHNGGRSAFVIETLREILGVSEEKCLDARHHPHIRADRLLVPSFVGAFGWPSAEVRRWLRARVLGGGHPTHGSLPSVEGATGGKGTRLWLRRAPSARRVLPNQEACLQCLERFGVKPIDPELLSVREQAMTIASASTVVAPHGAALANLVFATPGTRVLELHQTRYAPPYFHSLAAHGQLLLARCEQPQVPPSLISDLLYEGPIVEPIVLEPDRVAAAVNALLGFDIEGLNHYGRYNNNKNIRSW